MKHQSLKLCAAICLAAWAAPVSHALDYSGLTALWRLDETANASFGNHNGIFEGTPAYTDSPVDGAQSAFFDGASYIRAGTGVSVDFTTPFSATSWVRGPEAGNDSTILGRMRSGNGFTGWELHVGTGVGGSGPGRPNVWLINDYGPNYIQVNSPVIVLDDEWHHVAFTYDGSGFASGVTIYVDGQDATGEASVDSLSDTIVADDAEINIGARYNGAAHLFRGSIYEASIWERVLTAGEIAEIYTHGIHPAVLVNRFEASRSPVHAGDSVTLSWESDPGAQLSIDQGIGVVSGPQGTRDTVVEQETTFTMTATKGEQTEIRQVKVAVHPLILEFVPTRSEIARGQSVGFTWSVHPGAQVSLNPGPGDVTGQTTGGLGTAVVSPDQSTTYVLRAERNGVSLESTVEIVVIDAPPAAAPDVSALAALWLLDGNTVDSVGGNDGEFSPQESFGPGLELGRQAAVFDGASYIAAGHGVTFDADTPFSATAWINGSAANNDSTIIGKMIQGGPYTGWELHVGTDAGGSAAGLLNVWLISNYGSDFIQVNSPALVLDGQWRHVAFTYDGSGLASGVQIYVDGHDATGETTADSLTGGIWTDEAELNIGARQNGAFHMFTGSIYEASLWNVALSPENIAWIYLNGIAPAGPEPAEIRISGVEAVGTTGIRFTWNSTPGRSYLIETSGALDTWNTLEASYPAGGATGAATTFTHDPASGPERFYRVRLNP